ncbi:hypothetical protein Tco_0149039 [Tanacetum coccineum]
MEVPDAMISDAIKKKAGYKYYMAKKVENEKAKIIEKPKEQHVSPIKSGRGKKFMCYGDQVAYVPNKLKKDALPRKTRSFTITEEAVVDMYNEWGQKLKGLVVDDPAVQSLLDLQKGSKSSRLESLRQKKQPVGWRRIKQKSEESANETDDADESDMDLSDNNPHGDDDAARHGVFMHNKSTATPNSTYLSASEVSLGTHVDVLATKTLMQEMFPYEKAHHIPSLPAKKIPYPTTYPQPSSLQAKAKKQMQKAKKEICGRFNFK